MFAKMKTGTKILGGFGIAILITALVGYVGYQGIAKISDLAERTAKVRLPSVENLLIVSEAQTAVKSSERTLLVASADDSQRERQYEQIKGAWDRAEKAWKIYEPLPQTKEEEAKWKDFVPAWAS